MKAGDKCDCGGILKTPQELGLNPDTVVSDGGWAWKLKDALICDKCGGNLLIENSEEQD